MKSEHPDNLPPKVQELKSMVEKITGETVRWRESKELEGDMGAKLARIPLVEYKNYSHSGAAHELLHLKLDLLGFPGIRQKSYNGRAGVALTMLHNLLQHRMFFPQLKEMGFDEHAGECKAVKRMFAKLHREDIDVSNIPNEPFLKALFAMLYARTKEHCDKVIFHGLVDEVYAQKYMDLAQAMGEAVLDNIKVTRESTPEHYREVLERCLDVLGIRDHVELTDRRKVD